jgi:hypothetical protein
VSSTGLLERDDEIAALGSFLDGIEGAGSRLMLIEGPAGIGKSSLLAEARRLAAADGHRTLVARGSLLERDFPFGVVRQLFEPELATPKERRRLLTGRQRPPRQSSPRPRTSRPATSRSPLFTASIGWRWTSRPRSRWC